jgi:hypothetical protein
MENKNCTKCQKGFIVSDEDLAFYKQMSPTFGEKTFDIPSPTLCPDCRRQKRFAWRNVKKLYNRKCDFSGEDIISPYAPNSNCKIFDNEYWWSDKWDPYQFGRDFDFSRPFFEQFRELFTEVPKPSRVVIQNENSEYTHNVTGCKNCYLVQNSSYVEDSYYGLRLNWSKDCIDCYVATKSEKCYECINIENCFDCEYCEDSLNCRESFLLKDCIGCSNCFGCNNLNNKQYWIENKPATKEVYEQKRDEFLAANYKTRQDIITKIRAFHKTTPKKFAKMINAEECVGDYITNSKNAKESFVITNCENMKYCHNIITSRNCYDYDFWGNEMEYILDSAEVGHNSKNILFTRRLQTNCSNIYYSIEIYNSSHDCFGCTGLRQAEYCVLNKKYSKEEYEKLVSKIIEHMKTTEEWGEFFPIGTSAYGYNETIANDFFPITKEQAKEIGANWQDEDFGIRYDGPFYEPLDINRYQSTDSSVDQEVKNALKGILKCEISGRPYKLQAGELAFYISNKIQIPRRHPDQRHEDRFEQTNPLHLWHRKCMNENCANEFETTYAPERPEKVFCETCYQNTIK